MAVAHSSIEQAAEAAPATVPPLESGDHLSRAEFERRYAAMPELKKAELIEGVVYVGSPVRVTHGEPHGLVMTWLGFFCAATPGVRFADNTTVRLDLDNEPQPDALLRIEPEAGGRAQVDPDGYLDGPPELVVEVAASSASIDRHEKLRAYRRNGVQEYIIWQVLNRRRVPAAVAGRAGRHPQPALPRLAARRRGIARWQPRRRPGRAAGGTEHACAP
jgi:Uma2 family endonuclease